MGRVLEYFGPVSMFPANVHLQIPNMTKPLMLGTLRMDQCILPIDKYTKVKDGLYNSKMLYNIHRVQISRGIREALEVLHYDEFAIELCVQK